MKQRALKCRVRPGMFADEWIAHFPTLSSDGEEHEAEAIVYSGSFVTVPDTREEQEALLRVYCMRESDSFVSVVLPQPTVENGPCVAVRETELTAVS